MPTLESDQLVFRFPELEGEASIAIDFQRTLRIPDTDRTYPLPSGLGSFPLRHVEDYAERLPAATVKREGVILPMWQAEAMWLSFRSKGPVSDLPSPVAIKVAAGKINAITGEIWRPGLHRGPQDYLVAPEQPWLDGYAIAPGVVRQFVAMPLGEGYTAEEQLTGAAEWGGLQVAVVPLRAEVWQARRQAWHEEQQRRRELGTILAEGTPMALSGVKAMAPRASRAATPMGLAPGGRMRQVIHPDPFRLEDWDTSAAQRVFVTLAHARDWKRITGEVAPNQPLTAKDYSQAGLPWFEHYGQDQGVLPGSGRLAGLKSVAKLFKQITGSNLPNSADVKTGTPTPVGPGAKGVRSVRTASSWDW